MKLIRFKRPDAWEMPSWNRLSNLRDELDRLFDSTLSQADPGLFGWTPALDVYENPDKFVVRVELPGMKKDELEISLHENSLTVAGERRKESSQSAEPSRSERYFGRFQRTFALPKAVQENKIEATYKDGILTVTLPKAEESKPKKIQVKTL